MGVVLISRSVVISGASDNAKARPSHPNIKLPMPRLSPLHWLILLSLGAITFIGLPLAGYWAWVSLNPPLPTLIPTQAARVIDTPSPTATPVPTLTASMVAAPSETAPPTATLTPPPTDTLVAPTPTPSATLVPSDTPFPTETATLTLTPAPSNTPGPSNTPAPSNTPGPSNTPRPTATPTLSGQPGVNHLGTEKVVLADYMLWYDPSVFDGRMTWEVPSAGGYNSDDLTTIQRHVALAQQACLNGLAAHWYGPQDTRTTTNFNQLLAASAGTNLRHVVVIQTNILPGVTEQTIIDALTYALANWAQSPNYLRLGGRPVLVFTDMPRPWGSEAAALEGWARIRAAVDPNHTAIWFAEGLVTTFNPLFDGLYVYRIDHAQYPESWLKQPRWATALRAVEAKGNLPIGGLYFADTIAPGFDDTRSVNAPIDLRSSAEHFARDRRNGGYYADTYSVIPQTRGDLLLVKSLNEWIEGTEIEPGASYGDLYVTLTCQYADNYRAR